MSGSFLAMYWATSSEDCRNSAAKAWTATVGSESCPPSALRAEVKASSPNAAEVAAAAAEWLVGLGGAGIHAMMFKKRRLRKMYRLI